MGPARHRSVRLLFLKQMCALHNPVPVLVVSGMPNVDNVDVEAEALSNGAFAFILKPVILAELDRVVALALAADRQGQPRA